MEHGRQVTIMEILKGVKARIVRKTGNSIAGRVVFEATSDDRLTNEEIGFIQSQLGYSPAGYGGPWNTNHGEDVDGYVVSWCCAASCD
jgi:hypothetical protein